MKIISLSANFSGAACSIGCCIKKYFYNYDYKTNIYDYLEISLISIIEILNLTEENLNYLHLNNTFVLNNSDKISIFFDNFDKLISHHDLIKDFTIDDYNNVIEKYKRRYYRLMDDIKNEDKIFFIRYGDEDYELIELFFRIVQKINPNLEIHFIHLIYDENNKLKNGVNLYDNNYYIINFYNYVNKYNEYNEDPFFKVLEFNWKPVYHTIYNKLNDNEKEKFIYYNS
jgi:hypothetical protein